MAILDITNNEEYNEILRGNKVLVIYSASFCKPCKEIYPYMLELSETYKDIIFIKVDVQKCEDIDDINTRVLEKFDKMKTSGEEGITNYIARNIHEHYSDLKVKLLNAAEITKNKDLKEFIDTVKATYEPANNENLNAEQELSNKGKE
jgi:thiol-disulfide isomerase/thioredoxin